MAIWNLTMRVREKARICLNLQRVEQSFSYICERFHFSYHLYFLTEVSLAMIIESADSGKSFQTVRSFVPQIGSLKRALALQKLKRLFYNVPHLNLDISLVLSQRLFVLRIQRTWDFCALMNLCRIRYYVGSRNQFLISFKLKMIPKDLFCQYLVIINRWLFHLLSM